MNPTSTLTPLDTGVAISATKVSGAGMTLRGTKNTAAGWAEVRAKRDALLAGSDWTQMPDVPLSLAIKAAWATYRQALRDLTDVDHVAKVVWPAPPAKPAPAAAAGAA